jgi:hypothetical protein
MEYPTAREEFWLKKTGIAIQNIPFMFIDLVGSLFHKKRKKERKRHPSVGYED